jgi:hypothetical protein
MTFTYDNRRNQWLHINTHIDTTSHHRGKRRLLIEALAAWSGERSQSPTVGGVCGGGG